MFSVASTCLRLPISFGPGFRQQVRPPRPRNQISHTNSKHAWAPSQPCAWPTLPSSSECCLWEESLVALYPLVLPPVSRNAWTCRSAEQKENGVSKEEQMTGTNKCLCVRLCVIVSLLVSLCPLSVSSLLFLCGSVGVCLLLLSDVGC